MISFLVKNFSILIMTKIVRKRGILFFCSEYKKIFQINTQGKRKGQSDQPNECLLKSFQIIYKISFRDKFRKTKKLNLNN